MLTAESISAKVNEIFCSLFDTTLELDHEDLTMSFKQLCEKYANFIFVSPEVKLMDLKQKIRDEFKSYVMETYQKYQYPKEFTLSDLIEDLVSNI